MAWSRAKFYYDGPASTISSINFAASWKKLPVQGIPQTALQAFRDCYRGEELADAVLEWVTNNCSLNEDRGNWFTEMLRAGGFLIELSDNCSIVRNPFSKRNNIMAGDDNEVYV